MPFINERLADNQELVRRNKLAAKATRTSRFLFEPDAVIAELQKHIVGQQDVIAAMADMLYLLKADFADPNRPLSVNLYLGPTGVGKTETVKVLSKALLGSEHAFCRIDMNTLAQEHYAAALTGAPPGYVGSKEGHTLFNSEAIEGAFSRPGIVLFDEIEKASTEVIRSILNILDTGKLKLAGGTRELNFCNSLIFMTSNLGAREFASHQLKQQQRWRKLPFLQSLPLLKKHSDKTGSAIIDAALKKAFDPEFINRIERILQFNSLDHSHLDTIINIELAKLNHRLKAKNATVTIDDTARTQLASFYNSEYGARNLAALMRNRLGPVLAKAMLHNEDQQSFTVRFSDGLFII